MEPFTPPTMDEIEEIVSRRRDHARKRGQIAFTGAAAAVTVLGALGLRELVVVRPTVDSAESIEETGPTVTIPGPSVDNSDTASSITRLPSTLLPSEPICTEADPGLDPTEQVLPVDPDDAALFSLGLFGGAGYGLEQARLLDETWQIGQTESKVKAGLLLRCEAGRAFVDEAVGPPSYSDAQPLSEEEPDVQETQFFLLGAYYGAGFDVEQASVLAEAWELQPVQAKMQAGWLALGGNQEAVESVVGDPTYPEF